MADSFADLWSTTAPLPPKAKPQTLSGASSSSNQASRPYAATGSKPDVFALLARSSSGPSPGPSSTGSYGSGVTLGTGATSAPGSRSMTPSFTAARSTLSKTPSQTTGDVFGDLLSSSIAPTQRGKDMTLAARLAMDAQRPKSGASSTLAPAATTSASGDAWAGLDALGAGLGALGLAPTPTQTQLGKQVTVDDVDDTGLGDFGAAPAPAPISSKPKRTASPPAHVVAQIVAMGFSPAQARDALAHTNGGADATQAVESLLAGSRGASPLPGSSNKTDHGRKAKSLWDLDEFADEQDNVKVANVEESFDFGTREDREQATGGKRRGQGLPAESLFDASPLPAGGNKTDQGRKAKSLWDLDDFTDNVQVANVEESFDFGTREDREEATGGERRGRGLLDLSDGEDGDGEVDLLGGGGAPRHRPQPTRHISDDSLAAPRPPAAAGRTRTTSPPPHLLGQIVEMGFSVAQARSALARTPGGMDVQAALESLLSSRKGSPAPAARPPSPPRARGPPKGQRERERERLERQQRAANEGAGGSGTSTPSVAEIQEHADRLLAQASEIGLSVFSKASAMWGKGKERVAKVIEERTGGEDVAGAPRRDAAGRGDNRPRWMQEAIHDDGLEEIKGTGGFKDDDDEEVHGHRRSERVTENNHSRASAPPVREEPPSLLHDAPEAEEVDLFAPAPAAAPRASTIPTPAPRRPQLTASNSRGSNTPSRTPARTPIPSGSTPPAAPLPPRVQIPSASPSALANALTNKTKGTESFKLGQYAVAAESYTSSLAALPKGHLLRVPLYTNRALARMRSGDYAAAEGDCARALGIVVGVGEGDDDAGEVEFDPTVVGAKKAEGTEAPVWSPLLLPPPLAHPSPDTAWTHPQGHGTDLGDGYVKALKRRAEAREARERWAGALVDWARLAGCTWAPAAVKRDAERAVGRVRGMVGGGGGAGAGAGAKPVAKAKPAVKPKPRPTQAGPSKAVAALQSANAAADAEDAERASLKDSVDTRVLAWKGGKEANIRALLCSLDSVLWAGILEGVRVKGLHEVVSAAQVKKAYMRAVGRVHPDKLNANNATVEQRMLANAVFGALNEAWIAFQAGQK